MLATLKHPPSSTAGSGDYTATPIGLVAGSGALPEHIIQSAIRLKRPLFVVAIKGQFNPNHIDDIPYQWCPIGAVSKAIHVLHQQRITDVVFAGKVGRPSLQSMGLDIGGLRLLKAIMKRGSLSDNAIFTTVIEYFERSGFQVHGVDKAFPHLMAPAGILGAVAPDPLAERDIAFGKRVVAIMGEADIGQAAIVQHGVVLGVEALEGTDNMIHRCQSLAQQGPGGVLVKMIKPHQDCRVDLPTIGLNTIEHCHNAGLRGIAIEAGKTILLDKEKLIERANQLGLFVVGL